MITSWIASLGLGLLWDQVKQRTTGPMGTALIATVVAVAGTLALTITIMVMTGRAERRATAACLSGVEADRLKRINSAMKDAVGQAQEALKRRNELIEGITSRVAEAEQERDDARRAAKDAASACDVVFDVDDPWLRRKPAKGAAASGR